MLNNVYNTLKKFILKKDLRTIRICKKFNQKYEYIELTF